MRVRSSLRIAVERHPVASNRQWCGIRSRSWNFPANAQMDAINDEHPVSEPVLIVFNFTAFAAANAQNARQYDDLQSFTIKYNGAERTFDSTSRAATRKAVQHP